MAKQVKDRVLETTTTTGTGAYTLGGALDATYRTFNGAGIADGDTFKYCAIDPVNGGYEIGTGTWNTGGTITRTTVSVSSNSDAAVNWSAGTRHIFLVVPAADIVDPASIVQCIPIACSDETTALTTGTAKVTFRMPYAFTLSAVRASVTTAPTGVTLLTVDINEAGTTILSTKLTFDDSEKTTTTAATPAVISDTALADDAEITIDIDAVGSTVAGAGLKVYLIGVKA